MTAAPARDDARTVPPSGRDRGIYVGLAVGVLALQLPLVPGAGLGLDPDAWRLFVAGRASVETGTYVPSRPPGYPFLELLSAVLREAPWWVFTVLTAVATTVAVLAVTMLARDLQIRAWPLVGAGLAVTSVVWINGTTYMDYNWSLAFVACALLATHRRHPLVAGVLAGLAVATRPTSVLALTAIAVVVLLVPWWTWRRFLVFCAAAGAVVVAFFAVPLTTYGPDLISAAPVPPSVELFVNNLRRAVGGARGVLGIVLALAVLGIRVLLRRHRIRLSSHGRTWATALAVAILVQLVAFYAMPIDAGYLIPVVAMSWLGAGLLFGRLEMAVLMAGMLAGSLLSGSVVPSVLEVTADRREAMVALTQALDTIRGLPEGTVVVVWGRQPQLLGLSGLNPPPNLDPMGPGTRVTLPTGQVLARNYHPADPPDRTYRLLGVTAAPDFLPVLGPGGPVD